MLNFFRKKKLNSAHGKNCRERVFLNYHDIKNILIVFNINSWEAVYPLVEMLEKDGKKVLLWTSCSKDQANISVPDSVRVIDRTKEVKWTQSLSQAVIEEFEQADYDTFLDLTIVSDNSLEYLLAVNHSKFCIGTRENQSKSKVYDFILYKKQEDDFCTTLEYLKSYLAHIVNQ